jgi:hypothetical protein
LTTARRTAAANAWATLRTRIYAAMSYYHDHRAEIDPIIECGDRMAALHDAHASGVR